jgi:hypothetical protein
MVQCCSLASNKESLIQVSRAVLCTWMGGGGGVMSRRGGAAAIKVPCSESSAGRAMTKAPGYAEMVWRCRCLA